MSVPTIERDNGGDYVSRVRPSDLESVDTEAERRRNQDELGHAKPGNDLARDSGAKAVLTGPLKDVRDAVQEATGGALAPEDSREVIRAALKLYVANRRALGRSVPISSRLVRVSVNDALCTFYTSQAALAGFASERGMALVGMVHQCEQRAERAMTAAIAFAKALGRPPRARAGGQQLPPGYEIDADGEEIGE